MAGNFIKGAARRSGFNQFILFGLAIAVVIIAGAFAFNSYYNLFTGPYKISQDTLLDITDVNSLKEYYVTVDGDDVIDTGYEQVTRNYGIETGRVKYSALVIGDKFLLVETPGDPNQKTYTGSLVPIPSDVMSQVIRDIELEVPQVQGHFLGYMLNAGNFTLNTLVSLVIVVLAFLFCIWGLARAFSRMVNPVNHPIMKNLKRFGDPEEVSEQIVSEVGGEHEIIHRRLHLTRNWIVQKQASLFGATRLKDAMWMYKHVTQHRTNGIPTGKTFSVIIWDRHGGSVTLNGKEKQIEEMMQAIYRRAPWIITGYTKDIEIAYRTGREKFAAEIDKRQQQIQPSGPQFTGSQPITSTDLIR